MKVKKWLSVILVIAMVMTSVVIPSNRTVSAADMSNENAEITENQDTEGSKEGKSAEVPGEEQPDTKEMLVEETPAEEKEEIPVEEQYVETEEQPEVIEETSAAEEETVPAEDASVEESAQGVPAEQEDTTEITEEQPEEETTVSDMEDEEAEAETTEEQPEEDGTIGSDVTKENTEQSENAEVENTEESENKAEEKKTGGEISGEEHKENSKEQKQPEKEKEAGDTNKSTKTKEKAEEDVPQTYSLLPLEEVKAYLILTGYTEQELTSMPVDTMLSLLENSEGEPVQIAEDATTVWKYTLDDSGIEEYEEYNIGNNEIINLYPGDEIESFQIELIVGRDGQLNAENKRYLVYVELSDDFEDDLEVEIYVEDRNNNRMQAVPENCNKWSYMYSDGVTEETLFDLSFSGGIGESLGDHGTVWLNFKSELVEDPRVDFKIYPVLVTDSGYVTIKVDITDRILNRDMTQLGAGYQILGDKNTDATFQMITYVNGKEYSRKYLGVRYWNWYPRHEGTIFLKEGDERTNVYENITSEFDSGEDITEIKFELKQDFSASEQYYFDYDFVMQKNYGKPSETVDNYDSWVKKIVIGHYGSIEEAEAAGAADITDDILRNGYLANYGGEGLDITVFKHYRLSESFPLAYDTLADKINIKAVDNHNKLREFTNAPVIGEADPWFRITGVNDGNGNACDTYIVENGENINMDTMYGYGYQTIFINESVDEIQPVFWMADSNNIKVKSIYINDGTPFEAGDTIACTSPETQVTFHVTIEDQNGEHTKNYNVSFVKKCSGPQLYVAGPKGINANDPVRSVFLDEYFEYKHDIFIANVGDKPLTGLRVELNATNCKLDDYWTVGGDNNSTLAAFDTTQTTAEYGELANVAKIRLLPDGDGEIEGTLTIYADGQEPVTIKLSGLAQNPRIITTGLDEAVKYVPYSYMVSTNNMYDWTNVEFTMTGDLPEGVEFIAETGEIYGVPQETGSFPISVTAAFINDTYDFDSSTVELTLTVKENTNDNVYGATDDQYQILEPIGEDIAGDHDFVLKETGDQLFVSNGEFDEFQALWLNGEKLVDGVDYTKEAGSTRITISSQTFENKANKDGANTIAAEFRTDDNYENELKRTAQNFRLDIAQENPTDDNPGGNTDDPGTGDDGGNQSSDNNQGGGDTGTTPDTGNNNGNGNGGGNSQGSSNNGNSQNNSGNQETGNDGTSSNGGNDQGAAGDDMSQEGNGNPGIGNEGAAQNNGNNQEDGNNNIIQGGGNNQGTSQNGGGTAGGNGISNMNNGTLQGNSVTANGQNTRDTQNSGNGNNTQNNSGNTGTTRNGSDNASINSTPYVTMFAQLLDKENAPLDGYTVEIHSTPKTAVTNENGVAKFTDVEFGTHSISVKKEGSSTAVTKNFKIQEGTALALNGDTIIAKKGSAFTLKVRLEGNNLEFISVETTDVKTEDTIPLELWFAVFAAAGAAFAGVLILRKRKYMR